MEKLAALRTAAFAALVMLVLELALGMAVNLFVTIPASEHGLGVGAAVGAALGEGPVVLAAHVILGLLLLLSAAVFLGRAVLARQTTAIVAGVVGLLAMLAAAGSGAGFLASGQDAASMSMAVATATAMLAYVVVLFRVVARP